MLDRIKIPTRRPNAIADHMRAETMHSLLDGRALWPDGTPRNGRAEPIAREMFAPKQRCEVLEALGIEEDAVTCKSEQVPA